MERGVVEHACMGPYLGLGLIQVWATVVFEEEMTDQAHLFIVRPIMGWRFQSGCVLALGLLAAEAGGNEGFKSEYLMQRDGG